MRAIGALTFGTAAVAVAAVTGCSSAEPTVLPSNPVTTVSTTTTATTRTTNPPAQTTSAEPTPTTTLLLPDEHIPEVDAFVRDFFAAYNAAQDSRDLSAFDAMYLPQCSGCAEMRDELVGWLADGGTVEGADWVILQQSSYPLAPGNAAALAVAYRTAGSAGGAALPQSSAKIVNITLNEQDGGWIIEDAAVGEAG